MILHNLKLSWRVIGRNPFFSAVNLFGISFTIVTLLLMISFLQNQFGANKPLTEANNFLYFRQLEQKEIHTDTIWTRDTTIVDGIPVIDSSFESVDNSNWTSRSGFSKEFLQNYFSLDKMTTAEDITIIGMWSSFDLYRNNKKYNIECKYIDEQYFQIFDFEWIEGRPIQKQDIQQLEKNIVITDHLAEELFGGSSGALGQTIDFDNSEYKIIGVIKKAFVDNDYVLADIFAPISLIEKTSDSDGHFGIFSAVLKCKNGDIESAKTEIDHITKSIPFIAPKQANQANFNYMKVIAYDHTHLNTLNYFYSEDPKESKGKFVWLVGSLLLIFCLVPILNLINLNVSRVLDRASEIGVRKAFGAKVSDIWKQIVFENIFLSLVGGFIGVTIALVLMYLINNSLWLYPIRLQFNGPVAFLTLIIIVLIGFISGYLPAKKIAKVHIVESLKSK